MAKASLGKRIRKAREWAGLERPELAESVGVSEGSVNRWETDGAKPTPANLDAIAGVVGVPVQWFRRGGPLPDEPVPVGFPEGLRYSAARLRELADELENEAGRGTPPMGPTGERLEGPDD